MMMSCKGMVLQHWCAGEYLVPVSKVVMSRNTMLLRHTAEGLSVQKKLGRLHMPQQGHMSRIAPSIPSSCPRGPQSMLLNGETTPRLPTGNGSQPMSAPKPDPEIVRKKGSSTWTKIIPEPC